MMEPDEGIFRFGQPTVGHPEVEDEFIPGEEGAFRGVSHGDAVNTPPGGIPQVPFEIEVARTLGHTVLTMSDIDRDGIEAVTDAALERVCDGTDGVYVSLDIDVLDPVYCPAQKYPEPAGLTSKQIIAALRRIGQAT